MTFRDNKLTHFLKPLLSDQDNSKLITIHHIHDDVLEEVLQILQVAVRIKSVEGAHKARKTSEEIQEDEEYKTEMMI